MLLVVGGDGGGDCRCCGGETVRVGECCWLWVTMIVNGVTGVVERQSASVRAGGDGWRWC